MKAKILVGAIAALIYGNVALAQDDSTTQTQGQQSPDNIGGSGLDDTNNSDLLILDQEDVAPVTPDMGMQDEGVGGSGDMGLDQGLGGSGQQGQSLSQPKSSSIPMQGQGGVTLYCTPVPQGATGGSGDLSGLDNGQSSLGGSDVDVGSVPIASDDAAFGGSGYEDMDKNKESKADMRGLTVLIGGGVEGYTGELAPSINPGPSVGVTAALRPSKTFGLELGYSGAVNNLDADVGGSGPDLVRNGASAAVTLGLTAAPVQPYLLGGFGMNWYNVNNGEGLGFRDDTNSRIPVGVGLRTHIGNITADARVNYNVLLSEDFAPGVDTGDLTTGSYNGTINLGGTF
ncbi:hypothetical protein [Archangium sp.]|jgi:hypothetical protein|uniref:hypothetical protein n=1 Tax=Archangium sp. TaxID=1872627 RepID=UPI002ED9BAC0